MSCIDYMRATAKNLGLDHDGVIQDWAEAVGTYASGEQVWLVAWTRPGIMVPANRRAAQKQMAKRVTQRIDDIHCEVWPVFQQPPEKAGEDGETD